MGGKVGRWPINILSHLYRRGDLVPTSFKMGGMVLGSITREGDSCEGEGGGEGGGGVAALPMLL